MGFVVNKGTLLHICPTCNLVLHCPFSVFYLHVHSAFIDNGGSQGRIKLFGAPRQ